MPEPIEPTDNATELATLRRVNAELVSKSATRKARVAELEASVTELKGKLATSDARIHELTVSGPLNDLAKELSIAPELFLEQFAKSYKVTSDKGHLALLDLEGKPIMDASGNPTPFNAKAIGALVAGKDHPQAKMFAPILIGSRASGAGGSAIRQPGSPAPTAPKAPLPTFGLR